MHLDHLGRSVRSVTHNRRAGEPDEFALTRSVLDVQGNVLEVIDARGNVAESRTYGMAGQVLRTVSHDAGTRRALANVLGIPLRAYDSRGHVVRAQYDAVWRPTHGYVAGIGGERLVTRTVYGESVASPEVDNLRGQVVRQYDGAGVVASAEFDFAGRLLRGERRLASDYTVAPDWIALGGLTDVAAIEAAADALLEAEVFVTEATWDALGRPVTQSTPDGSVSRHSYNEAGLLEAVEADVRGGSPPTVFVSSIEYDVRGRRSSIAYGNGTTTTYEYDPITLRLTRIHTTRASDGAAVQDLRYVYDAVGNIVEVDDLAQSSVFFANAVVSARQRYTYDALYRLATAAGREHTSQGQPVSSALTPGPLPDTADPAALRLYTETYRYDAVGNIAEVQHTATGGSWTRAYEYDVAGNRLLASSAPGDPAGGPYTHNYAYDAHGNMTAMPQLAAVDWDHADRLTHADLGGGGDVWFVYDSSGNRVRKVRVNQSGSQEEERVYLGAVELYRERQSGALQRERETLHVADDSGRICLVETLTVDAGAPVAAAANTSRYQHSNHLGSASLELDEVANTISYEEYHPYGSSAYRAVDSSVEVSAKRYRYAGKERDEETGLDHVGARYYAAWLGRWTSADPIGLGDGVNRYAYVRGNPISLVDPSGTSTVGGLFDSASGAISSAAKGAVSAGRAVLRSSEVAAQTTVGELDAGTGVGYRGHVTTGRGSGGKGAQVWASEGEDPGPLLPSASRKLEAAREDAAAREAQARFEQEYERTQNLASPDALFEDNPAYMEPYLRDQSAGMQDDFLRFNAQAQQRMSRALGRVNGGVRYTTNITMSMMGLAGEASVITQSFRRAGGRVLGLATHVRGVGGKATSPQKALPPAPTSNGSDFVGARSIADLRSRLPSQAERVGWRDVPGGAEFGIKWKWTDGAGNKWTVRAHSLDPTAPVGSNAGTNWVYRVEVNPKNVGGRWQMDRAGNFHKRNVTNENSPYFDPDVANDTHIPFRRRE